MSQTQTAELVQDKSKEAITYKQDGAWTKIMLPKGLQVEHDILSPGDHKTVWFKATIVGWAFYNGVVKHAFYRKSEGSDTRIASFYIERGRSFFVENID